MITREVRVLLGN